MHTPLLPRVRERTKLVYVQRHWHMIEQLAAELKKRTMSGNEVSDICEISSRSTNPKSH